MKKLLIGLVASVTLHTNAMVISEVEPNSTLTTAQSIEGSFSSGANENITNADASGWEWVSIESLEGDDTFDYYTFEAQAGQNFIFDVDFGMVDFDPVIGLWSLDGNSSTLMFKQDDDCSEWGVALCSSEDKGSEHTYDPRFSWKFDRSGTFVIGVARYFAWAMHCGFFGSSPTQDDYYTLNISRDMAAVPEPAGVTLIALGMIALGFSRKRKAGTLTHEL